MPDININITNPIVIIAPDSARVSVYDTINDEWIDYPPFSGNNITINLPAGNYDIYVYTTINGVECKPNITNIDVIDNPKCECGFVTSSFVRRLCNGTAEMVINIDDTFQGECAYRIGYTGWNGDNPQVVEYDSITSPIVLLIEDSSFGSNPQFKLEILCCDNNEYILCADVAINEIIECQCIEEPNVYASSLELSDIPNTVKLSIEFVAGLFPSSEVAPPPYTLVVNEEGVIDTYTFTLTHEGEAEVLIPIIGTDLVNLVIEYSLTTPCGVINGSIRGVRSCGTTISYAAGMPDFPNEHNIFIGEGLYLLELLYNTFQVPAKFIVENDGIEIINSGYIGTTSLQIELDAALAARGLPSETITNGSSGSIDELYYFNSPNTYVTIKVYSPLLPKNWNYKLNCTYLPPN